MPEITSAKSTYEYSQTELIRAIRIWVLRLLVEMDASSKFLNKYGYEEFSIANFLELNSDDAVPYDAPKSRKIIEGIYRRQHATTAALPKSTVVAKNIKALSKSLGLGKVDSMMLHFAVICKNSVVLSDTISLITNTKPATIPRIFATCLRLDIHEVSEALRLNAPLARTGLLVIDQERSWGFNGAINLLDNMLESIEVEGKRPVELFRSIFVESAPGNLTHKDYPHLHDEVEMIKQYISNAIASRKKGVNILLYGPPGTGKTELARLISKNTKAKLYEIGFEGSNGLSLSASERFRAFRSAQSLFSNLKNHLILFDEVEDVFKRGSSQNADKATMNNKAWLNRILEENPVPAFWVTNDHSVIDDAFLRRFDIILEVNTPPVEVRRKVVDQYLGEVELSDDTKSILAEHKHLSPAIVERASCVFKVINGSSSKLDPDTTIKKLVGNTMRAMFYPDLQASRHATGDIFDYDLEVLNADCDMTLVAQEVIKQGGARICIYGPPGTGKSAFGKYIANASNKPLMVRKASDILSPYLGESEKNMAAMFKEARSKNAVLVLDEADTYLQDRRKLQRSWEISGVNEMLTQIESYDGVFICSTNLMDSLDQAVLRRFDLKIRFNALQSKQREKLFSKSAEKLGFQVDPTALSQLQSLENLTPGDFSNVIRQSRFRPINDQTDLLGRLKAECNMKQGAQSRRIGF